MKIYCPIVVWRELVPGRLHTYKTTISLNSRVRYVLESLPNEESLLGVIFQFIRPRRPPSAVLRPPASTHPPITYVHMCVCHHPLWIPRGFVTRREVMNHKYYLECLIEIAELAATGVFPCSIIFIDLRWNKRSNIYNFNAVCGMQLVRQRGLRLKTLRFPCFSRYFRPSVLYGGHILVYHALSSY